VHSESITSSRPVNDWTEGTPSVEIIALQMHMPLVAVSVELCVLGRTHLVGLSVYACVYLRAGPRGFVWPCTLHVRACACV